MILILILHDCGTLRKVRSGKKKVTIFDNMQKFLETLNSWNIQSENVSLGL